MIINVAPTLAGLPSRFFICQEKKILHVKYDSVLQYSLFILGHEATHYATDLVEVSVEFLFFLQFVVTN